MYPTSNPTSNPQDLPSSTVSQVATPLFPELNQPPPHCAQCGTVQTRQWRKNQMGDLFCEACGADTHMINVPPDSASKRQSNVPPCFDVKP